MGLSTAFDITPEWYIGLLFIRTSLLLAVIYFLGGPMPTCVKYQQCSPKTQVQSNYLLCSAISCYLYSPMNKIPE